MADRSRLTRIWEQQRAYNKQIRQLENPDNFEYWMKQYLLGAVSEVDEILSEINWKIHRRGRRTDRVNLGRELADLTKYVISMWEWSGFTSEQMLDMVEEKSAELEAQFNQDFLYTIPAGKHVVISDIDGTLGDYRSAFVKWVDSNQQMADMLPADKAANLAMEVDLGMDYLFYRELKERFEAEGGYQDLELYSDVARTLKQLFVADIPIILYTARPASKFSRIWMDTWQWLNAQAIASYIAQMFIGNEERIGFACELQAKGHRVLLLDDDPGNAIRAASTGVSVLLRAQPYNAGVAHPLIMRVAEFDATLIQELLERQNVE